MIQDMIRKFNSDRDWDQFHTPENLAKSISIEAGELLECFQWTNDYNKQEVSEEIADILIYLIIMADKLDLNLYMEVIEKVKKNESKYPITKCKGSSKKYTKLEN